MLVAPSTFCYIVCLLRLTMALFLFGKAKENTTPLKIWKESLQVVTIKSWGAMKINWTWQHLKKKLSLDRQIFHFIFEKWALFLRKISCCLMFCLRTPICPLWKCTVSHQSEESVHKKDTWGSAKSANKHLSAWKVIGRKMKNHCPFSCYAHHVHVLAFLLPLVKCFRSWTSQVSNFEKGFLLPERVLNIITKLTRSCGIFRSDVLNEILLSPLGEWLYSKDLWLLRLWCCLGFYRFNLEKQLSERFQFADRLWTTWRQFALIGSLYLPLRWVMFQILPQTDPSSAYF